MVSIRYESVVAAIARTPPPSSASADASPPIPDAAASLVPTPRRPRRRTIAITAEPNQLASLESARR
jgi:hypothetical protein